MFKNALILLCSVIITANFGCGSSSTSSTASNSSANVNANVVMGKEIKLDPANLPAGLSAKPVQMSSNMPPGISVNAMPPSGKTTPGIPSDAELKKGYKPGKFPTPGIPDQDTIRKQLGAPTNAPPANNVPMMKGNRKLGGKPQ
ncbi:MAG: hypothetical protein IPL32_01335 [Chloracidobacterium sp.]|nr:hypothetical protein [Chloracidobacterium sp.]